MEKNVFFRALPESPKSPPPLTPIRATWSIFSDVKNNVLRIWQKNTDDNNDVCNDNYDGNFDDKDDKKWPNNIQLLRVLGKITKFMD